MQSTILHIDFDSFFASVEQQNNPKLRNIPIGVTATNGRTCIIASSREAKQLGIKTGTRSWDAFRLCPTIKLVPADFTKYWEISQKFIDITKDYSPYVEVFSIDELFMDITKTTTLFGGTQGVIDRIKTRIAKEIGQYITVSIGVSHNKLLAKLASGLNKPNGITSITPETLFDVYSKASLTDICGIGERIKSRLNAMGIYTFLQLRQTPIAALISEFGNVEGQFLYRIGQGKDDSPVLPYTVEPTVKSVGRNYCLPRNEYSDRKVLQNVYELCEEVALKLRRLHKKARTVGWSLRGSIDIQVRKTFPLYIDTGKELFTHCFAIAKKEYGMTEKFLGESDYIRQISVWAGNLEEAKHTTLSLFDTEGKRNRLIETIDKINEKFGDHTIRNGFLLYSDKLTTVPNGYMADKFERIRLAETANEALKNY